MMHHTSQTIDSHPFIRQLDAIEPGRVRTWFCPDVLDTLADLEVALSQAPDTPLLALAWPPGADLPRALESIVHALAGVAWARWPDWYGEKAPFSHPDVGIEAAMDYDGGAIDRLGAVHPTLNRAWVRQGVQHCRQGRRPIVTALPPAVQVRQLMLALAQPDFVLLLALESEVTLLQELHIFARTATWAAGESGARVAAFVPATYKNAVELDTINYGAITLTGWTTVEPVQPDGPVAKTGEQPAPSPVTAPGTRSYPAQINASDSTTSDRRAGSNGSRRSTAAAPRRPNDEPLRLVSPPILGRPHPASPGEQLLAAWLARDGALAALFEFNQRVETSRGESYVVDLLWREGKLTVEVDGYSWHSSPHAFAADRHRDYRLLCDGYRTLRLPHDEVMDDPVLQVEKIRDVVRAIQKVI